MHELGQVPAEGAVQQHVLGRGRDPLLAADDVGDAHEVIVDHVRQVVGRKPIGFDQHLIVDLGIGDGDGSAQAVVEHRLALVGHRQAHHVGLAGGSPRLRRGRIQSATTPIISQVSFLGRHLLAAQGVETLARAKATVGRTGLEQARHVLGVDGQALGLAIGPEFAAHVGAFVPLEAEPAQGAKDGLLAARGRARAVGVLDPQHEGASVAAREGQVEQGHVGGPHVGVARGARGDANARCHRPLPTTPRARALHSRHAPRPAR